MTNFIVFSIFSFLACVLSGVVWVAGVNNGYGSGDLSAYFLWTIFFCAMITSVFSALNLSPLPKPIKMGLAIILPLVIAFGFGLFLQSLLGFWFRLFSFPVTLAWALGGLATGIFAAAAFSRSNRSMIAWGLIGMLGIVLLPYPISQLTTVILDSRRISVVTIYRIPSASILSEKDLEGEHKLEEKEISWLKSQGIRGKLRSGNFSSSGEGRDIRIVLIMDHSIKGTTTLNIPKKGSVMYVQRGDKFIHFPQETEMSDSKVELVESMIDKKIEPIGRRKNDTNFWIIDKFIGSGGTISFPAE